MKYTSVFRQKIIARPRFKAANIMTLLLLLVPIILLYRPYSDNNTFMFINMGKRFLSEGVTNVDTFTLHEGLHYPAQQWLSSAIFYKTYITGGFFLTYLTTLLAYFYTTFMLYKLINLLGEDNTVITYTLVIVCNICLGLTAQAGSQVFSLPIIVTLLFFLEKAIFTGNIRFLAAIPVLSVFLVNLDASMWVFFILLLIAYVIDGLNIKRFNIYQFISQHMKPLIPEAYGAGIIVVIIMISYLCAAINPFGFSTIRYALKAYPIQFANDFGQAGEAPSFANLTGLSVFALYTCVMFSYFAIKSKSRLRYMLMAMGTAYMGLLSINNIPLFIICTLPFIAFYIKDVIPLKRNKVVSKHPGRNKLALLLVFLLIAFVFFYFNDYVIESEGPNAPVRMAQFIKANLLDEDLRLFNEHQTGGYLEYCGIKPFIDSRIDMFSKTINRDVDIASDYERLYAGETNIKELLTKYHLNYALVSNNSIVNAQIKSDNDFRVIQQDREFCLYTYNGLGKNP